MPRQMMLKLWNQVQEPRVVTTLQTLLYVLVALAGAGILLWTPSSIEGTSGLTLTVVWGWFAILGGVLGAFATPGGKWFLERPAIYMCGTAVAFYLGLVGYLQFTTAGNRLVQMAFISIAGVALAIRFEHIKAFDYEPGK